MTTKTVAIYLTRLSCGGAEFVGLNLARGLKEIGYNVLLVAAQDGGEMLAEAKTEFDVVILNSPRVFRGSFKLARFLRERQPDVLIAHYFYCNLSAALGKLAARTNTTLIFVDHGLFSKSIEKYKNPIVQLIIRYLSRFLYRTADKIVAVSQAVREESSCMSGLPNDQIKIIYNPVITDRFKELLQVSPEHPWLREHDRKVILAVGRLSPEKAFSDLIQALSLVRKSEDVRLIILGDGTERPKLETIIASLDLSDHVALAGFQKNVFPWLQAADLFVLCSKNESFGNVIVEALACGTPVVSTDLKGPAEILENGRHGILSPAGNIEKLAQSIVIALNDEKSNAEQLRVRGQYFTTERSAKAYASLIEEALTGAR